MTVMMWVLAALAAARTWRLLAVDDAGSLVRRWFDALVWRITPQEAKGIMRSVRRKNVSRVVWRRYSIAKSLGEGWDCPHCLGFWLAAAWVATGLVWSDSWPWQLAAGSFALSYVVGHLGASLDSTRATFDDFDGEIGEAQTTHCAECGGHSDEGP